MSGLTTRDLTGQAPSHRVAVTLTVQTGPLKWLPVPHRPFYSTTVSLVEQSTGYALRPYVDYLILHTDDEWSTRTQREMGHFIVLLNPSLTDRIVWSAQVLGGGFTDSTPTVEQFKAYLDGLEGAAPPWGAQVTHPKVDVGVEIIRDLTDKVSFQYLIEATEGVRTALLYGDTEDHDRLMEIARNTRGRYIRRIQDLMQVAQQALSQHGADRHGHQLTTQQIGLDRVANYPKAPQVILDAGVSDRYLTTPRGLHRMLDRTVVSDLSNHQGSEDAHRINKDHIGLSRVPNYAPATMTDAQLGRKDDRLMTPGVTLDAIHYRFTAQLDRHHRDTEAHHITPTQIGLGQLRNYPVLDPRSFDGVEVEDEAYLTPARLKGVIDHHYYDDQISHVYDENNPHGVTARELGLGEVDNYSQKYYDQRFRSSDHTHTADSLPITQDDLDDWHSIADWVLDSQVFLYQEEKVIWDVEDGKKSGKEYFYFPAFKANKVVQVDTVLQARDSQGTLVERPGTVSLNVQPEPPETMQEPVDKPDELFITLYNRGRTRVPLDGIPSDAWPLVEARMWSLETDKSNLYNLNVTPNIWREAEGDGYRWYYNENNLWVYVIHGDTIQSLDVRLDVTYKHIDTTRQVHRYSIDHETFWTECKRLYPTLDYRQHKVIATLYYLIELPDHLKGPEGVFFREDGDYEHMGAGGTTPDDVGLGLYPNKSAESWYETLASRNHNHPNIDAAKVDVLDARHRLQKGVTDVISEAILEQLIQAVPTLDNTGYPLSFKEQSWTRQSYIPKSGYEYTSTHWKLKNLDGGVSSRSFKDTRGRNMSQTYTFGEVGPNTGVWQLTSRHELTNAFGKVDKTQEAKLEVDTGKPVVPWDWLHQGYVILGRSKQKGGYWLAAPGSQPYWFGDPADGGLGGNAAHAKRWLNGSRGTFDTVEDFLEAFLRWSVLYSQRTSEKDAARAWLDSNRPGWDMEVVSIDRYLDNSTQPSEVSEVTLPATNVVSATLTSNAPESLDAVDVDVTNAYTVDSNNSISFVPSEVRQLLGGYSDPEPLPVTMVIRYRKHI